MAPSSRKNRLPPAENPWLNTSLASSASSPVIPSSALSQLKVGVGAASGTLDHARTKEAAHEQEVSRPTDDRGAGRADGRDQEVEGDRREGSSRPDPLEGRCRGTELDR